MKRLINTQRAVILLSLLATIAAVAIGTMVTHTSASPGSAPPVQTLRKNELSNMVRGYLAAAIGRSAEAETSGGIFASEFEGRKIYLPAVTVFLEEAQTKKRTDEVLTDLSGRFTVQVPEQSRYRLCWRSKIYGEDCLRTFVSAGTEPVFLNTVLIRLATREGFVASFGNVRFADDSPTRTLEPLSDINAFPIVSLLDSKRNVLAEVPVNNFGEYLLPYVPNNETIQLNARIENGTGLQTVQAEAFQKNPRLIQYQLTIKNSRPKLNAIVPINPGTRKRVQIGTPGQTVLLTAEAHDRDGDPLEVRWSTGPAGGVLSAKTGTEVRWTLPTTSGRFSVLAIVSDKKGGYDRYTVRLSVGAPGVAFSGVVAGSDGKLLDGAEVEINGKREKTDGQGRFISFVPEADRYVFNIRKAGYGFYSKIYDRSVAGGRWTLTLATVSTFDPTNEIRLQDQRSSKNCPGPDSSRINWKEGPSLRAALWQDGKGNNIPPSTTRPFDKCCKYPRDRRLPAWLPWESRTQQAECGPGLGVSIPANALETESGAAPVGQVELTLSTIDLNTPEQMPGDDGVERSGGTGWMQSFGAGTIELRDTGSGQRLRLKSGQRAEITIPVDRMQLTAGGKLPKKAPLLFYDERNGMWRQDGTLQLDSARQNYVAQVKHFSTLNTDIVFTNPSCVRVQSSIPTPYDLEVTIPMPGGAAPKVKKITITDAPPHVIYHLPNNTPITIVAIAPGSGTTPPRSHGVFIVDTGPPHAAGFGVPPPASACATEVTLSEQTFPSTPSGGEFLHGLYSFAATTINEADIPTPGTLSQQLDQATRNYYAAVDPVKPGFPNGERSTLIGFRTKNGFTRPPGFQLCGGSVCDNPDDEINVVFANSGDLGFGRDMHCRRTNTGGGTGFDYACYVTNYGNILTDDSDDVTKAVSNVDVVATVAMEYSRILDTDALTDRHVKFYVYGPDGNRVNSADLDSGLNIRPRPIPQLCMVCHGGAYPGGPDTGVPGFDNTTVRLGAKFLPFDLRFYTFPSSPDKKAQQAAMKRLNEEIVRNAPLEPGNAIADVIDRMYLGSSTQLEEVVVPEWQASQLPNTAAQETFYKRVIGNACRTCHVAQPFASLRFDNVTNFLSDGYLSFAEQRVCQQHVMPHAKRTHDIFWGQYWQNDFGAISPTIAGQFQVFGDTIRKLPVPTGWVGTWPPPWNGQLCGPFTTPGTTPPSFYSTFVHPLWTRDYRVGAGSVFTCTNCHSGLSGNATDTRNALLTGTGSLFNGSPLVIANNAAGSILVHRVRGTGVSQMPAGCPLPDKRCLNESGGVYNPATDVATSTTSEINRIVFWINNGAAP